jgi:prophage antirepressor-like protein
MNKQVSKFLEFNGKTLVFLAVNGEYWIALKPICEVLGVDYIRVFRNTKEDAVFGQLLSDQAMVAADGKTRKMASLPEKWIYGWIFQLESKSPELLQYKKLCYEVLNDYFHGTITGRKELLSAKAKAQTEIDRVMNTLHPNDAITIDRASKTINQVNAKLRALDSDVLEEERNLFSQ